MSRQRVLELIFAALAIVCVPPYLIDLWLSHTQAALKPKPSQTQIQFDAAYQAAKQLEQEKQYEAAIPKFREAELYASKLDDQRYEPMRKSSERVVFCYIMLGRAEEAHQAYRRLVLALIDEGDFFRKSNRVKEAAPKLEEAERRAMQLMPSDDNAVLAARVRLVDVYWKLKRYPDAEHVYARMIQSVKQPLNDYTSVLGEKHMEIAKMRSDYNDWEGAAKSCLRAIEEFDGTLRFYSGAASSQLASARTSKVVAMYWLQIAYGRQGKMDLAVLAGENAFQANQEVFGSYGLASRIAKLALEAATTTKKQDAIEQWQQRLSDLPKEPCPAPNIYNPACITPLGATAAPTGLGLR